MAPSYRPDQHGVIPETAHPFEGMKLVVTGESPFIIVSRTLRFRQGCKIIIRHVYETNVCITRDECIQTLQSKHTSTCIDINGILGFLLSRSGGSLDFLRSTCITRSDVRNPFKLKSKLTPASILKLQHYKLFKALICVYRGGKYFTHARRNTFQLEFNGITLHKQNILIRSYNLVSTKSQAPPAPKSLSEQTVSNQRISYIH